MRSFLACGLDSPAVRVPPEMSWFGSQSCVCAECFCEKKQLYKVYLQLNSKGLCNDHAIDVSENHTET